MLWDFLEDRLDYSGTNFFFEGNFFLSFNCGPLCSGDGNAFRNLILFEFFVSYLLLLYCGNFLCAGIEISMN